MNLIVTNHFILSLDTLNGRFFVKCKDANCTPRGRRISAKDARYLQTLKENRGKADFTTFDMACVMDMGVGVFAK
jgi:hypothetical protein